MSKRYKPSQRKAQQTFTKTAIKVNPANTRLMARGGYRM